MCRCKMPFEQRSAPPGGERDMKWQKGELLQVTRSLWVRESEDAGYNCSKFHARDSVLHYN